MLCKDFPISSCFVFYIITSSLSPSSIWSKPQYQHQPSDPSVLPGKPKVLPMELQLDKETQNVLKEEHLQLDPTKEQGNT